jgi:hypothetical protein
LSEVRDVFDLSASDNWIAPSLPILFTVLSEHEMKQATNAERDATSKKTTSK